MVLHTKKKVLKPIIFTKEGLQKVKQDYELLKKERPLAVDNLKKARELGDLSENGFYKASRARLSSLDNQLFRLEMMIKLALVRETPKGVVDIGSIVTISDGENVRTLKIVGDFEADPINNKVTTKSPFGRVLVGKKEKDTVIVNSPKGLKSYIIIKLHKNAK